MRKLLSLVCVLILTAAADVRAGGDFTKTLTPEEAAATGLAKLTPAELARLKAVVERYKSGEVAAVQQAAETKVAATEAKVKAAEQKAAAAEAKLTPAGKKQPGWLAALITLEKTGDKPEAAEAFEARLAGDFRGWRGKTVFTLENGQRWQQTDGEDYVTPPVPAPRVKIYPGAFGSYWLQVEGVRQRVRVKPLQLE